MATKKTINKLIEEKWDKLNLEEKTYINSEYTKINSVNNNYTIKSNSAYILGMLLIISALGYIYRYMELFNISKYVSDYRILAIMFAIFGTLWIFASFISEYKINKSNDNYQKIEDWIFETTKKRK
jgi:hypothetical protein